MLQISVGPRILYGNGLFLKEEYLFIDFMENYEILKSLQSEQRKPIRLTCSNLKPFSWNCILCFWSY